MGPETGNEQLYTNPQVIADEKKYEGSPPTDRPTNLRDDLPSDLEYFDHNIAATGQASEIVHKSKDNSRLIGHLEVVREELIQHFIRHPEQLPPELILALGEYITLEATHTGSHQTSQGLVDFMKAHPEKQAFLLPYMKVLGVSLGHRLIEDKDVVQIVQEGLLEKYRLQGRNRLLRAFDSLMGRDHQVLGTLTETVEQLIASKKSLNQQIKDTQATLDVLKEKIRTEEHAAHIRALEANKLMLDQYLDQQRIQQERIAALSERLVALQSAQIKGEADHEKRLSRLESSYQERVAALEKRFAEREAELQRLEDARLQEIDGRLRLAETNYLRQSRGYDDAIAALKSNYVRLHKEQDGHSSVDRVQEFEGRKIVTAIYERKSKQTLSIGDFKDYQHVLFALEDLGSFETRFGHEARSDVAAAVRVAFSSIEAIQKTVASNKIFPIVVAALDNPEISIDKVASLFRDAFATCAHFPLNADNFARALQREYPSLFKTTGDTVWLHNGTFLQRNDFEALRELSSLNSSSIERLRHCFEIKNQIVVGVDLGSLRDLSDYSPLERFESIKDVTLNNWGETERAKLIRHLTHLESITVIVNGIDGFPSLSPIKNPNLIRSLELRSSVEGAKFADWLSSSLGENLKSLTTLENLLLVTDYSPPLNLSFCGQIKTLKRLDVLRVNSSVKELVNCPNLTELRVREDPVTWEDLSVLADLPSLKVFDGKRDLRSCPAEYQLKLMDWLRKVRQ